MVMKSDQKFIIAIFFSVLFIAVFCHRLSLDRLFDENKLLRSQVDSLSIQIDSLKATPDTLNIKNERLKCYNVNISISK